MFNETVNIMLYVNNPEEEKIFWKAIGFEIFNEIDVMGYHQFNMKSSKNSTLVFTIFNKEFIEKVSPEVANHIPSVLFETENIYELREKVAQYTDTASLVKTDPFLNFNFSSPSGIFFAVKQN